MSILLLPTCIEYFININPIIFRRGEMWAVCKRFHSWIVSSISTQTCLNCVAIFEISNFVWLVINCGENVLILFKTLMFSDNHWIHILNLNSSSALNYWNSKCFKFYLLVFSKCCGIMIFCKEYSISYKSSKI